MIKEVYACDTFWDCLSGITTPTLKYTSFTGLFWQVISDLFPAILGIAGFLTVIFIVISGIQFITSSGNPEAAAGARNRLIFAIVGFTIIILAFAILKIVDNIFLGTPV